MEYYILRFGANLNFLLQIDVELHSEVEDVVPEEFEFGTYMRQFFHNASSYLPAYAEPYCKACLPDPNAANLLIDHPWAIKMTLINAKNPICEEAFRFSKYFQRQI
jgi:hypothetical protein